MEQPRSNVLSKATLFSWGFVATLLLAVFWATVVYTDGKHNQEQTDALQNKMEIIENRVLELQNEVIELRTEQKFYNNQIRNE